MEIRTINVLGVSIARVTYDSAMKIVEQLAREPRPTAVCPANTHILAEARHDPGFGRVMEKFDLVFPDGMPVVWALNLRGAGLSDRVYGPYFTRHALKNTPQPWRHFFFGDTEQVLEDLKRVAVQLQPNIDIVGSISPPFRAWTESDEAQFAETINRANPDFVWVALPGGRMERWIIDPQAISPGTSMPSGLFKRENNHWVFSGPTPPSFRGYDKDQTRLLVDYILQLTPEEQRRVSAAMGHARAAGGSAPSGSNGNAGASRGSK